MVGRTCKEGLDFERRHIVLRGVPPSVSAQVHWHKLEYLSYS